MAAMTFFEGFNSTWAQDGGVYGWEQAQYRQGWSTIGDQKPSVEQFNNTHQIIDQKANYLWRQLKTAADDAGVSTGASNNNTLKDLLDRLRDEVLGAVYPVGAIYLNYNDDTNPGNFLPGTWSKITSGFLYSHGATQAGGAGSTGGASSIQLTVGQLPSHSHSMGGAGAHSHTASNTGSHTHSGSTNSTGSHSHSIGASMKPVNEQNNPLGRGLMSGGSISTSSAGTHSHSLSINSSGTHSHSISAVSNHTHSIGNTGNGDSISIIPPRVTVYMFRRTA